MLAFLLLAQDPLGARDTPAHPDAKHVRAVTTGVTKVIDGDTFTIDRKWTPWRYLEWDIRSRGIDTPEKGYTAKCAREKQLGLQATILVQNLMASKEYKVRLKDIAFDK
jgi:endonuclease YncB( thermonuclease family)